MTQFLLATPNGIVFRNNDAVRVSNTALETTLLAGQLSAGMLSMNNRVKFTLICSLSTAALLPGTLTIRVKYGSGVLTLGGGALALLGGATNTPFKVTGRIANKANAASQIAYGEITQASGGLTLSQPVSQQVANFSVDSTLTQNVAITAQFSLASASNILTVQDFEMEIS
ncbi:hypothetical protein TA3x_000478 [Tundrisphaera sp. TA3]|uniref:hypothetical protein n=1 Tax=Tundrisphaera sp. TA3 TaxID=3435775 RepID=UPI003EB977C6